MSPESRSRFMATPSINGLRRDSVNLKMSNSNEPEVKKNEA